MKTRNQSRIRRFTSVLIVGLVISNVSPSPASSKERWALSASDEGDKRVVVGKRVLRHGRPSWAVIGSRAYLGVEMIDLTSELRDHFGVGNDAGVMVSRVVSDSPADAAGIEVGDILTAVDSVPIDAAATLAMEIAHRSGGETVDLEAWRNGRLETLQATLEERDRPMVDIRRLHIGDDAEDVDVSVLELEIPDAIEDMTLLRNHLALDPEVLNQAVERLNEELSNPEWHQRIVLMNEHENGLQERLEALEERLRELEQELESLPDHQ